MTLTSGIPSNGPTPNLPPLQPQAAASGAQQLLQQRGDSGWHFDLGSATDRQQAEDLLKGFQARLGSSPEVLSRLAALPHGQALIECLEAAATGQLDDRQIQGLQRFLSRTADIDISYGGGSGIDGLLGPRTIAGLESFCARLETAAPTGQPMGQTTGQTPGQPAPAETPGQQYLSTLELSAQAPGQPVLTSLSLFADGAQGGEIYERSPYHDDAKFVPRFAMTAFHESGSYRSPRDPYAVGTITRPQRRDDLGGKTYGVYQFESSVYADGTSRDKSRVNGSTLMRFVSWSDNPFGAQLREAAERHGVASAAFDQVWKQLALQQNKLFGEAQQQFVLHERSESVSRFMDEAQLSPEVRQDPRIVDLIMGTTNHVGGLADSAAEHLARVQREKGRKLSANETGIALAEYKKTRVTAWFQSSPGAWNGLRNRFNDERSQFA